VIRLGDRRAEPEADDGSAGSAALAGQHVSPGLTAVLASLEPDSGCRVLDLGPAVAANIDVYGRFARHVRVLDAARELASHVVDEEDGAETDLLVDGLMGSAEGPFDVVLAWDLVSHVDFEVARIVFSRLRDVCRQGAKVFLMTYEGAVRPAHPQTFDILGEDRLLYRPSSPEMVPGTAIAPAQVERMLAGFRVESSFLLRHGVREYVAMRV
jgi:hypothetical protein